MPPDRVSWRRRRRILGIFNECWSGSRSGRWGSVRHQMAGSPPHAARLSAVQQAFTSLPERYLGAEPGFDATYRIRLGDIGKTWEVRLTEGAASVRPGTCRRPDVTIGTDAATWLRLRQGELSGIEAFSERSLYAKGDLDLAVGFEGRFARPAGGPLRGPGGPPAAAAPARRAPARPPRAHADDRRGRDRRRAPARPRGYEV